MSQILKETFYVFALLEVMFAYLEYRYKPDIIYIAGRLFTNPKYLIPSITIPPAYFLLRIIINFLFA